MSTLFLIRGLAGSGKSSLAALMTEERGNWVEADDYFVTDDGEYNFDPAKLKLAHEECRNRVKHLMERSAFKRQILLLPLSSGKRTQERRPSNTSIYVANTFSQNWEMVPYKVMAKTYGYNVFVIECQNDFGSVHDVPDEVRQRMSDRWEANSSRLVPLCVTHSKEVGG